MALAHSRGTSCAAPRCAANHRRGDSFGTQCRYEPSPNSLTIYPESPTQKVETLTSFLKTGGHRWKSLLLHENFYCWELAPCL